MLSDAFGGEPLMSEPLGRTDHRPDGAGSTPDHTCMSHSGDYLPSRAGSLAAGPQWPRWRRTTPGGDTITTAGPVLAGFNEAAAADAERELRSCCASERWARAVAAGRPYPDLATLLAAADAELAGLDWPEVEQALAAHPRIGDRVTGDDRESAWSRREQAGMGAADAATRVAFAQANREYEARFGHVLLIFASGRTDTEMLAAARARLGNDPATERGVVRAELGRIARHRLERLLR